MSELSLVVASTIKSQSLRKGVSGGNGAEAVS